MDALEGYVTGETPAPVPTYFIGAQGKHAAAAIQVHYLNMCVLVPHAMRV